MTENKPKPKPVTETEKPDALETIRLGELSGGVTPTGDNKDLGDEEMRNSTGG